MKCKNCGGNYKTKELVCPYCETPNMVGYIWMVQKSKAELEYEAAKKDAAYKVSPFLVNRLLKRILVVLILVFICTSIFTCLCIFVVSESDARYYKKHKAEIINQLQEDYDNKDYEKVNLTTSKYNIYEDEYKKYAQAGFMYFAYEQFVNEKLRYLEVPANELKEDDYRIESCIRWGKNILKKEFGLYSEILPENEDMYEKYYEEVKMFYQTKLYMSEDDIDMILTQRSIDSENMSALVNKAYKGRINDEK